LVVSPPASFTTSIPAAKSWRGHEGTSSRHGRGETKRPGEERGCERRKRKRKS
jgi:hypothetical protein